MKNQREFGSLKSTSQGLRRRRKGAACFDGYKCHPKGGAIEARRPGGQRARKAAPRGAGTDHSARTAHEQRTNSARTAHEQRTKV